MPTPAVISFTDEPASLTTRQLTDLPDRVVEGNPHHTTEMYFTSPDARLMAGIWTSTPGKWHAFTERDEFCYIVSGHVRLIDEEGLARTYRAGDAFLIPNGFRGYWDVIETTTKHFVIRDYTTPD